MRKKGFIPSTKNPWHAYYLLSGESDFYPDEFPLEKAYEAIDWAYEQGFPSKNIFLAWFGDEIRRQSRPLFSLPVTIKRNGKDAVLNVPIYSPRDFGDLHAYVLMEFRRFYNLRLDCPASRMHIIGAPQVFFSLRYEGKLVDITIDPFEVEHKNSRVAVMAFGRGVKDKNVEVIAARVVTPQNDKEKENVTKQEAPKSETVGNADISDTSASPEPEPTQELPATLEKIDDIPNESTTQSTPQKPKSRTVYTSLGVLFGFSGTHSFYARRPIIGAIQLALSVLSCGLLAGLSWFWALSEVALAKKDGSGTPFTPQPKVIKVIAIILGTPIALAAVFFSVALVMTKSGSPKTNHTTPAQPTSTPTPAAPNSPPYNAPASTSSKMLRIPHHQKRIPTS